MDYNFLYREMAKPYNFEELEKYLRQTDEDKVRYTDYFIYRMASNAKEYFKDIILRLDNDPDNLKYTTFVTKEYVDDKATRSNEKKYAAQFELMEADWSKYRDEHEDEFNEYEKVDSYDDLNEYMSKHFVCEEHFSLDEAFQGYLCANELLKRYGKDGDRRDFLPMITYKVSKEEFKEQHSKIRASLRAKYGIPEDDELKVRNVETRHTMKTRHSKAVATINSDSALETYTNEFYDFLVGEAK